MTVALILEPILRRQRELGYEVEYACGTGEFSSYAEQHGLRGHPIRFYRGLLSLSHFSAMWHLYRLMRRERYDVVHTHTPMAGFLGRIAARLAGVPVIIHHMRGTVWGTGERFKSTLFTALEWIAARCTSFVFTVNSLDAEDVARRGIRPRDKVLSLGCGSGGLNTAKFDPARVTDAGRRVLRRELRLGESDVVMGFVGRVVRHKGIWELLDAFVGVAAEIPEAKLLLVGGTLDSEQDQSTTRAMTERIEADAALRNRVVSTGFRDDVPQLLAIMDILVLPSHREGFGMVIAEAGAMGVPVVATATRGAQEAIEPGVNGLLAPIGDPSALQSALVELASDENARRRMGQEGQRFARERFSEDVVLGRIEQQYRRLLDGRGLGETGV